MPRVDMQNTPHAPGELASLLDSALQAYGANQAGAALLLATILVETGNGQKIWNNNVGNISTANDSDDWWQTTKGAASALKFKAYPTIDDGMADFVRYSVRHSKFYEAAQTGDVRKFLERYKVDYNPELVIDDYVKMFSDIAKRYESSFANLPAADIVSSAVANVSNIMTGSDTTKKAAVVAGAAGLEWLLWAAVGLFILKKRRAHG